MLVTEPAQPSDETSVSIPDNEVAPSDVTSNASQMPPRYTIVMFRNGPTEPSDPHARPLDAPPTYEKSMANGPAPIYSQNIGTNLSTTPPQRDTQNQQPNARRQNEFESKLVQSSFITEVFAVLTCHVLVTSVLLALSLHNPLFQSWMRTLLTKYSSAVWSLSILSVILCCLLLLPEAIRRRVPRNITWLVAFTLSKGFLLAVISTYFQTQSILMAMSVMVVACLTLTFFNRHLLAAALIVSLVIVPVTSFVIWVSVLHENQGYVMTLVWASVVPIFLVFFLTGSMWIMVHDDDEDMTPHEHLFAVLNLYYYLILGVLVIAFAILYGIWDSALRRSRISNF